MGMPRLLPTESRATNTAGTPGSVLSPRQLIKTQLDQNQLKGSVHTGTKQSFFCRMPRTPGSCL